MMGMRNAVLACALIAAATPLAAIKIDISPQEVEQALTIARSRDQDRAKFHAPYIKKVDTPFVEQAELVTEFRRVILLAEERARVGDRYFGYSVTSATEALKVFRRRVAVIARIRFHPQNNYVGVPEVTISASGHDQALIGVRREPIMALSSGRKDEFVPVLGALVEGVFEAEALKGGVREFIVSLNGNELGRATFDLAALN
jgi:hypothetical protein